MEITFQTNKKSKRGWEKLAHPSRPCACTTTDRHTSVPPNLIFSPLSTGGKQMVSRSYLGQRAGLTLCTDAAMLLVSLGKLWGLWGKQVGYVNQNASYRSLQKGLWQSSRAASENLLHHSAYIVFRCWLQNGIAFTCNLLLQYLALLMTHKVIRIILTL